MPNPPAGMYWQLQEKDGKVTLLLKKHEQAGYFSAADWYADRVVGRTTPLYSQETVHIEKDDGPQKIKNKIRAAANTIIQRRTSLRVACEELDLMMVMGDA